MEAISVSPEGPGAGRDGVRAAVQPHPIVSGVRGNQRPRTALATMRVKGAANKDPEFNNNNNSPDHSDGGMMRGMMVVGGGGREGRSIAVQPVAVQPMVLSTSDFHRMKEASRVMTKEEKAALAEGLEEAMRPVSADRRWENLI